MDLGLRLIDLLDGGLGWSPGCPTQRTWSALTWSAALSRRFAWQGLGRSPRLTDLLGGNLVGQEVIGLILGTLFSGT